MYRTEKKLDKNDSNSDKETMEMKVKFSIRYKLIILLILIPLVSLTFFALSGSRYFLREKNFVVFDSASRKASVLASEYSMSIQSFKNQMQWILGVSNFNQNRFGTSSEKRFKEQKRIEYIFLCELIDGKISIHDKIVNYPREIKNLKPEQLQLYDMKQELERKSFNESILDYSQRSRYFRYFKKVPDKKKNLFLVALVKLPELYESFAENGVYTGYLVDESGKVVIEPKFWRASQKNQIVLESRYFRPAFTSKTPQGVYEQKLPSGNTLLVAYAQTKVKGAYAFSIVDRSIIDQSIGKYLAKSALILLSVLMLVVLVSFLASHRLTESLRMLVEMMRQIASGNFKVVSKINSRDEIQFLANSVEKMSTDVQNLMENQLEQTRMESELGMVQLVQKNLFPPLSHQIGNLKIECRYASASEAGGDWFHYSVIGKKLVLWIGDATGHGAPAAMITSAAKSASSVIEMNFDEDSVDPSKILEILNRAVSETAKKSVMMTFFLAVIDIDSGEINYANASHEFPIIIPDAEKLKKKDLNFLCDVTGKRLGDQRDSTYKSSQYQMKSGEKLFLFTDGITDLENAQGEVFGEGQMMRKLIKIAPQANSAAQLADSLDNLFLDYRGKTPLVDDLMFIVCHYNPDVENKRAS